MSWPSLVMRVNFHQSNWTRSFVKLSHSWQKKHCAIHSDSEIPVIGTLKMGHSLIRSLICSHRSLVRLLRTARFAHALRSLTHSWPLGTVEYFLFTFQGVLNHCAISQQIYHFVQDWGCWVQDTAFSSWVPRSSDPYRRPVRHRGYRKSETHRKARLYRREPRQSYWSRCCQDRVLRPAAQPPISSSRSSVEEGMKKEGRCDHGKSRRSRQIQFKPLTWKLTPSELLIIDRLTIERKIGLFQEILKMFFYGHPLYSKENWDGDNASNCHLYFPTDYRLIDWLSYWLIGGRTAIWTARVSISLLAGALEFGGKTPPAEAALLLAEFFCVEPFDCFLSLWKGQGEGERERERRKRKEWIKRRSDGKRMQSYIKKHAYTRF